MRRTSSSELFATQKRAGSGTSLDAKKSHFNLKTLPISGEQNSEAEVEPLANFVEVIEESEKAFFFRHKDDESKSYRCSLKVNPDEKKL